MQSFMFDADAVACGSPAGEAAGAGVGAGAGSGFWARAAGSTWIPINGLSSADRADTADFSEEETSAAVELRRIPSVRSLTMASSGTPA